MDKKVLLEKIARNAYEKDGFNGAWLYAENGKIVGKGAVGWRDADNKLPVEEDTIFEMASITKMFTATAVMLLVREGKLGLDEEYIKYFPGFPYAGITIRHLLTHTGCIPDYDVEKLVGPILEKEGRVPSCSEIIDIMKKSDEEPVGEPGEKFCYSDIGYCLLANAVEKASGLKFEEFMKKNIFEPAGMKDSGIYHTRRDGRPSDRFAINMVLEEDGNYVRSDISDDSDTYVWGSDGLNGCDYLYTTIFDMLAWDRALREEKVLTLEEQEIMYTPGKLNNGEVAGADEDDGGGYGFGWGIKNDSEFGRIVGHGGGMPGLSTWFERFVDADRVLVHMSCRDFKDARASEGFFNGMEAVARDKDPEPVISIEEVAVKNPDKSKWESYCGKYERPDEDEFAIDEIYMEGGELYADAFDEDGNELRFRLYPIGGGEFGRKGGMLKLKLGDGCLTIGETTCKKLK